VFFYQDKLTAIFGGRNVGDSDWADASILINGRDAKALAAFYDGLWLRGTDVSRTKKLVLR